jgi:hypothetical protein
VTLVSAGGTRKLVIAENPGERAGPADRRGEEPGPRALHARLEGAAEVAALSEGATRDLEQDLFALRDKSVLRFDRDAVAAAKFTVGDSSFDVKKESAAERLASLLWTLSSLKAKTFADETGRKLAEHGLDRPAREVALLGADGKELDHLYLSAERGERTFARSASHPRIVEIESSAVASLPRTAKDIAEEKPQAKAP